MKSYEAIVLGAGGAGSAALLHLARRGVRVLGLDRFAPPHSQGSSHGHTRVIRQAYFEHPDYVPLLLRAYQLWDELERETGELLFHRVGLVEAGPPHGVVVPGVLASAAQHRLKVDIWSHDDCRLRLPALQVPEGNLIVFEQDAGFLYVERCVAAHLQQARQAGAELRVETVRRWRADGQGVQVETDDGTYRAGRLVVTAGAWAGQLLQSLPAPLRVLRKHLHWYPASDPRLSVESPFPAFFIETDDRSFFYGFPAIDQRGVKVAEHSGGVEVADPLQDDKSVDPQDRRRVEQFLKDCLPSVQRQATDHAVCYYTMTADEHFIVDRLPESPQVVLAAGLSGHGFKFIPVLGEALAQLALDGRCDLPVGFLALRD